MSKQDVLNAVAKRMKELNGSLDDLGSDLDEVITCIHRDLRIDRSINLSEYLEHFIVRVERDNSIMLNF